jgi:outer membrane protein TolC
MSREHRARVDQRVADASTRTIFVTGDRMITNSAIRLARRAAIAFVLCLGGCAYVAEQPEISPSRYAPAQNDRPWVPSRAYSIPFEQRPPDSLSEAGSPATSSNSGKYDLPQLIDIALHNNPGTRVTWDRARAAAAAYGASRAPYYPLIDTQMQTGYTRELFEIPNSVGTIRQWQVTPIVELTYTLRDFGRRNADARAAREQLAAANFGFNRKMQDVVFTTQRAFYSMGAAKAAVKAAEQNVELAKTDDEAVSRRVDLGLATEPALLLSRQRVAQSEYDLASAQLLVREAQADIAVALGVAANAPLDIPSLDSQPIPAQLGGEIDALIE